MQSPPTWVVVSATATFGIGATMAAASLTATLVDAPRQGAAHGPVLLDPTLVADTAAAGGPAGGTAPTPSEATASAVPPPAATSVPTPPPAPTTTAPRVRPAPAPPPAPVIVDDDDVLASGSAGDDGSADSAG